MDNQTEEYLSEQQTVVQESIAPGEVVLGEFIGFNSDGEPLVTYAGANEATTAMSTIAITHENKGRQVALLFANGDFSKPVIMGLIYSPLMGILNSVEVIPAEDRNADLVKEELLEKDDVSTGQSDISAETATENTAYVDGNRVVLEGKEEIVLKCGEASITLTKAGKILIRGKYLLNRSSGVNRILGGSVQVN